MKNKRSSRFASIFAVILTCITIITSAAFTWGCTAPSSYNNTFSTISPEIRSSETADTTEPVTEKSTEKATEKPTAKPTEKTTEKPTVKPTQKPVEKNTEAPQVITKKIEVTSVSSPVSPGEYANVSIQGTPNTDYSITVYYKSGPSTAKGLYSKTSDGNGNVSWEWKVGTRTSSGTYQIYISGGGDSVSAQFTVN